MMFFRMTVLTLMSSLVLLPLLGSIVSAQNTINEDIISGILESADRWYTEADKSLIQVIAKTANTATLQVPVAQKDGQIITSYYITWAPFSFEAMQTGTSTTEQLAQVKDSDKIEKETWSPMYVIEGNNLIFTIDIADANAPIYVTIMPEDVNRISWDPIEDFQFVLNTVQIANGVTTTTAVAGDINDRSKNIAIINESCIRDATANRVTLVWDLNLAWSNATRVEISHRGDESVGPMTVRGTPPITDRRMIIDTPHRNIQLFKFKPLDAAGAMVGEEIHYICKPTPTTTTPNPTPTPTTPTDPAKPIPVVPATGPAQTAAIIFFVSLLLYIVYRKVKA